MWWSKHTEDFPKSPFESDETTNNVSLDEDEYYFKEKYVVMGKDGRGTIVQNVIRSKVENGLLTFYIENHEKPKAMINEHNIVFRPKPTITFNLSEVRYYKTLECDLGINGLENEDE